MKKKETKKEELIRRLEEHKEHAEATRKFSSYGFYQELIEYINLVDGISLKSKKTPDNIIPLGCITYLDLPVDRVLEGAKERLESAVIIGYDKDGELYFSSTYADGGTVIWLLEMCKKKLLETST